MAKNTGRGSSRAVAGRAPVSIPTRPSIVTPDRRPAFEEALRESEPRVRLVVTHEGHVALRTCDGCTGTTNELIEVLEEVLLKAARGGPLLMADCRYQMVTCSRCGRTYRCTPLDDFIDPAPDLGWTQGSVCEACLWALAGLRGVRR